MLRRGLIAVGLLVVMPPVAMAQSSVAGLVKDTSGAVLPGVTVEASSPALIEKVKTVVSNEAGQYRVVDLRPGTYKVTFRLPGFITVVREGIVLEANFTAPINIEMQVGSVEEAVTVTAATPVVDVQSSQRREVVSQELIEALPTGRSFVLMAGTAPAVTTGAFDVGGSSTMWSGGSLLVHGSPASDSRTLIDGMIADALIGNGQCSCVYDNEAQTQEIVVQVSGGPAEVQLSGVLVNRIPKMGSNTFSGDELFLFSNSSLQGQNVDAGLMAQGVTAPARLAQQYDINYTLGGPILRDKLWFFVSGRNWAYNNYVANSFNADGSQARIDNKLKAFPLRLTSQVSERNRLTGLVDWAFRNVGHFGLTSAVTPEATMQQNQPGAKIMQLKWTSTISSHLLFEAGVSATLYNVSYSYQPGVNIGTCEVAYNLCPPGTGYGSISHNDTLRGLVSVAGLAGTSAGTGPEERPARSQVVMTSLSYISGAHAFKIGFQDRFGFSAVNKQGVNGDLNQLYRNGVPFAVQVLNTPTFAKGDLNFDGGVFVQDTWTMKGLTLSPGLRWDHFNASLPEQSAPPGRFQPARDFPAESNLPNWNNVMSRFGAAYDVFGHGRTAVKGSVGWYVTSQGPGFAMAYSPMIVALDQRNWTDVNQNDIAEENEIGPSSNTSFGVRSSANPVPNISRPYQLVWDVGLQQEVARRVGLSVSYNRRQFYNIIWSQNLAVNIPTDYTRVNIPNPQSTDQTLPIYNLAPSKLGAVNLLDQNSSQNQMWYQGVDVTMNLRLGKATLNGGTSTGRTESVNCQVADPNSLRFCDSTQYQIPFQTSFKVAGTYALPYDTRLSANFQRLPGAERIVNYGVVRAILPTLTQSSVNVRLNEPGSLYNPTLNQLDVSLSKSFRTRGLDLRPELSLFNLFNANPVLTANNIYGPSLNNAITILSPRVARLGVTVKF